MNLQELSKQLHKLTSKDCNKYTRIPVLVGDSAQSNCVAAYIVVENTTKYRSTHVRFAEDLDTLINDIINNYSIAEDDLMNCIIPIAGFTIEDLYTKLN